MKKATQPNLSTKDLADGDKPGRLMCPRCKTQKLPEQWSADMSCGCKPEPVCICCGLPGSLHQHNPLFGGRPHICTSHQEGLELREWVLSKMRQSQHEAMSQKRKSNE